MSQSTENKEVKKPAAKAVIGGEVKRAGDIKPSSNRSADCNSTKTAVIDNTFIKGA